MRPVPPAPAGHRCRRGRFSLGRSASRPARASVHPQLPLSLRSSFEASSPALLHRPGTERIAISSSGSRIPDAVTAAPAAIWDPPSRGRFSIADNTQQNASGFSKRASISLPPQPPQPLSHGCLAGDGRSSVAAGQRIANASELASVWRNAPHCNASVAGIASRRLHCSDCRDVSPGCRLLRPGCRRQRLGPQSSFTQQHLTV